jgi:hypothetical protein
MDRGWLLEGEAQLKLHTIKVEANNQERDTSQSKGEHVAHIMSRGAAEIGEVRESSNIQSLRLFETKKVEGRLTPLSPATLTLYFQEETNDPVYRCCCVRANRRNVSTRFDTRAASSARGYEHASPLGMWPG